MSESYYPPKPFSLSGYFAPVPLNHVYGCRTIRQILYAFGNFYVLSLWGVISAFSGTKRRTNYRIGLMDELVGHRHSFLRALNPCERTTMAHPTSTGWTCSSCQAKFQSSDALRKHMTRNHNGRLAVSYGEPKLELPHEQVDFPPVEPAASAIPHLPRRPRIRTSRTSA